VVKTFSGLELSKSAVIKKEECGCYVSNHTLIKQCKGKNNTFIDGHIVEAYLPKGAQMIVCFMNGNINDAYLTNFI
jgi:intein-encoded DNA endonuclease-like protein